MNQGHGLTTAVSVNGESVQISFKLRFENVNIEEEVLMWIGRLVHSRGAATLKRLSAETVPDRRSCKRCASLERI